jgi:hypothetical protein
MDWDELIAVRTLEIQTEDLPTTREVRAVVAGFPFTDGPAISGLAISGRGATMLLAPIQFAAP